MVLVTILLWYFFSVPYLLWHGASLNNGHLRGRTRDTHGFYRSIVGRTFTTCLNDFALSRPGIEPYFITCKTNTLPNELSYDIIHPLFSATSDIGDVTSIPVPGSCTFSSHGSNTRGFTHYSFTSEYFSACQSRCQLDTRCNGFTHNSFENNCRLHETSESQSAGSCYSCTFVSKSCIPSISEYEKSSKYFLF